MWKAEVKKSILEQKQFLKLMLSYQLSKAIKQVCQIARICYCSFPAFCFSSFAFFLSFSRFQFALLIVYFLLLVYMTTPLLFLQGSRLKGFRMSRTRAKNKGSKNRKQPIFTANARVYSLQVLYTCFYNSVAGFWTWSFWEKHLFNTGCVLHCS